MSVVRGSKGTSLLFLAAFFTLLLFLFNDSTRHSELVVFLIVFDHAPLTDYEFRLVLFEFVQKLIVHILNAVEVKEAELR